jgi:DNA polymerase-3 subunit beta
MTVTLDRPPTLTAVGTKDLLTTLTEAKIAVAKRPVVAILTGVRLASTGNDITVRTFDYETSYTSTVPTIGHSFDVVVNHAQLLDVVKGHDKAGITMLEVTEHALVVTQGRSVSKLVLMDSGDYPELPAPAEALFTTTGPVLADLAKRITIAAGRDDTLPVLTTVLLELDATTLTAFATDRYRLAMFTTTEVTADRGEHVALVPAVSLKAIATIVAKESTVGVAFGQWITVTSGARVITVRTSDAMFPRVRAIMPTDAEVVAEVNRKELINAVKRVAKAAERNTPVRLTFTANVLTLATGYGDASATEALDYAGRDEEITLAFHPFYLLDGLTVQTGEQVTFAIVSPTKPAIIATPGDASYSYLLMPVRLS